MAHCPLPIARSTHTHTIPIPMHTHAHPHPYLDSPFSTLFPFPPDITSFLQLPPCITHPISLVDLFAPHALVPGTARRPSFNCHPWLFPPLLPYFCALYFLEHPTTTTITTISRPSWDTFTPCPCTPTQQRSRTSARSKALPGCLPTTLPQVIFIPHQPGPNFGVPTVRMDLNRHM